MLTTSVYRTVREMGFNLRRVGLARNLPRYWRDLREWRRRGGGVSSLYPVLSDWSDEAGSAASPYFHQDLLVAQKIFRSSPQRHVDVGSRIDGFVAHVAAFRAIDVFDIRPLHSAIRNVRFVQADLMSPSAELAGCTDSLSCLHALEHFGLGRYGDRVDPEGHLRGFRALIGMLAPNGTLYLSFPIGRPVVEFNAHRVFGATEVLGWPGSERLRLEAFDFIDDRGTLHEDVGRDSIAAACANIVHGCGIYTFQSLARS
jgi:hypothetical protein